MLTLEKYRELFGENKHPFTGVDYVSYYGDVIREAGAEAEIIFANDFKRFAGQIFEIVVRQIFQLQLIGLLFSAGVRRGIFDEY